MEFYVTNTMPLRNKSKFYRTIVKPAIMYMSKYWAIKKQHNKG